MAIEITRDLKEINEELKTTNSSLRQAGLNAASFQRSLKSDPTNQTAQRKAIEAIGKEIELCSRKVELLREKQAKLIQANGPIAKTSKQYQDLQAEIERTEFQQEQLVRQMKKMEGIDWKKVKSGAEAFGKSLKQGLTTCLGIYGAIIAIGKTFSDTADDIAKASAKFNESAESWQRNAFVWDKLTGDADAYSSVLSSISSLEGQAQNETEKLSKKLALLGLSFEDIDGKSQQEVLALFIERLSQVENAAERTALAVNLFGESTGSYIALMAGTSKSQLASFNAELEKTGILTNEEVAAGAELHDAFEDFGKAVQNIIAKMADKLIPTIETLLNMGLSLIPVLDVVASAIKALGPAGSIALIAFAGMISALPGLIMMLAALNIATKNIAIAAAAYAALAAATAMAAGFMASINQTKSTPSISAGSSSLALQSESSALSSGASKASTYNEDNSTTNEIYNDNSQNNIYVDGNVDAEQLLEAITDKKRALARGGRR